MNNTIYSIRLNYSMGVQYLKTKINLFEKSSNQAKNQQKKPQKYICYTLVQIYMFLYFSKKSYFRGNAFNDIYVKFVIFSNKIH